MKILKAISETMTCDKCPYPCESEQKYGMSSQANCVNHWSLILSQIDTKIDWSEARSEIGFLTINEKSEISRKQCSEIEGIEEAALAAGLRGDEVTMHIADVLEKNGRYDLLPPCYCKGDDE